MKRAIVWSLLLLAFVPLIVDSGVFFPYITGKSMAIKILVMVATLLCAGYAMANNAFRKEIAERFSQIKKNPIVISVTAFFVVYIVSTLTAVNTFRAFFGDIERAEGLLGMSFFFGFFLLGMLVFAKKDWLMFCKLSLITGGVLFINQMYQWLSLGQARPSSFTGNPIYIAILFLFTIFAALMVIGERGSKWHLVAWAMLPLSLVGILVSQTRGVMIGMGAGLAVAALIMAVKSGDRMLFGRWHLKKIALVIVGLVIMLSVVFLLTKSDAFWKKIPGIDRLAAASFNDPTLQTRLISLGVSTRALNPITNGPVKFLTGWGPENFSVAYNKYYNPKYFEFEQNWFDRAHNKLMDVAVMNGVLGLVAYLALWVFLVWVVLRRPLSIETGAITFFGVAYFIQNLFVFESVSTYIPFFVFVAFGALLWNAQSEKEKEAVLIDHHEHARNGVGLTVIIASVGIFFAIVFVMSCVAYAQMRVTLNKLSGSTTVQVMKESLDSMLEPYTYAQQDIRQSLLGALQQYVGKNEEVNKIFIRVLQATEELAQREPYNPRAFTVVAQTYAALGQATNNMEYMDQSLVYYEKALTLAPKRQDTRYYYGYTLALVGEHEKAEQLLKETIELNPRVGNSYFFLAAVLLTRQDPPIEQVIDLMEKAFTLPAFTRGTDRATLDVYKQLEPFIAKKGDARRLEVVRARIKSIEQALAR